MEQAICQSCAMPLTSDDMFGTNVDGSVNSSEESDGSDEIENSEMEENKMYVTINGEKLEIQLEDNAAAVAFAKMQLEKMGCG